MHLEQKAELKSDKNAIQVPSIHLANTWTLFPSEDDDDLCIKMQNSKCKYKYKYRYRYKYN